MRGTRYGDFSRSSFDPAKRYRAVLMQQGRVQLDADWNEQADVQRGLTERGLADLLGASGAPSARPGYLVGARTALEFEGDATGVAPRPTPLSFGEHDEFTIEVSVRWTGAGGTVVDCLGAGDPPGGYRLSVDDAGVVRFGRLCVDPSGVTIWADATAADPLPPDRWVRVAVVALDGQIIIYTNAHPVADVAMPTALPVEDGRFVVGASADGEVSGFIGLLADLRVWAGVRSAAELAAQARADAAPGRSVGGREPAGSPGSAGLAGSAAGSARLLAWWPLDEGQGEIAHDRVGQQALELLGSPPPRWRLVDLDIGAGRYYVDGVACELDGPVRFSDQPAGIHTAAPADPGSYLVYLEVWERTISAIEDGALLEEALGGLDTAVRSEVVASVGLVALPADAGAAGGAGDSGAAGGAGDPGAAGAAGDPGAGMGGSDVAPTAAGSPAYGATEPPGPGPGEEAAYGAGEAQGSGPGDVASYGVGEVPGYGAGEAPGSGTGHPPGDGSSAAGYGNDQAPAAGAGDAAAAGEAPPAVDAERALAAALVASGGTTTGTMSARHDGEVLPGNFLYRVEVHRGGHTDEQAIAPDEVLVVAIDHLAGELTLAEPWPAEQVEVDVELVAVDVNGAHVRTRHSLAAVIDQTGHRVRLGSDLSAIGDVSEPRLRAVRSAPTFKWSRRNGAEMYPIGPARRGATTVALNGAMSGVGPLAPGDVVELVTDQLTVGAASAKLFRVASLPATNEVALDRAVPAGVTAAHHPFLRRWITNQSDDWGVPIRPGAWQELEDGIQISFGSGDYRQGDYWWIVARRQPDALSWPTEHGHPQALPPAGVERRRAVLARLDITDSSVQVLDLRGRIEPLVRSGPPLAALLPAPAQPPPSTTAPAGSGVPPAPPGPGLSLPPGFALVGPPGAGPPGFRPTGLRVVTRPQWSAARPLDLPAVPLRGAVVVGDRLLVATSEELWAVDSGGVTSITRLPQVRQQFTLVSVGGTLLLVGGHPSGVRADGRVFAYDLEHATWSERRPLPRPVSRPGATVLSGSVHVVGGNPPGASVGGTRDHQVYDPGADRWAGAPPLPEPMAPTAAGTVDGRVHVVGATGKRLLGRHEGTSHLALQPGQTQWIVEEPLPGGRSGTGTVTNADGRLTALAGPPHRPAAVVVLEYTAGTGTWDALPPLPGPLTGVTLVSGPPGPRVLGAQGGQQVLYQLEDDPGWELYVPGGAPA